MPDTALVQPPAAPLLRERLAQATTLRELGRLDEAEPIARALLAEAPDSWPAMVEVGICARLRRDLPTAAAHLAAALVLAPRERSVRLEYATTLREQSRLAEAEALYRSLLAEDANAWPALAGIGICARLRRALATSAAYLAAAVARNPHERSLRHEYATTLREQRRLDAAEALYHRLAAADPGFWPALLGLGLCARMRGDRDATLAHFAAATAAAPDAEQPWFELAAEHRDAGRLDEARTALRTLAANAPASGLAWLGLGLTERAAGNRPAALAAFREGYARDPQHDALLLEIANEERTLGHFAEAEHWLRRAGTIAAVAGQALLQQGDIASARQQPDAALALYAQAAERPGAPVAAHGAVAQTLADLGRLDVALASLDAAERRIGQWPEIALRRIALLRRAGRREEARAAAEAAIAAMPGHFPLWCEWFETERFVADPAALAPRMADAPVATAQERAHWHMLRAQLAVQQWDHAAADAALREALALDPLLTGAHEAMARVALLRFDLTTAQRHLAAMQAQRAAEQVALGRSPHLAHSHLGNMADEFAMDPGSLAALAAAQLMPAEARIATLLARVRAVPDHTPTAIALMLALRQAGQLSGTSAADARAEDMGADDAPPLIPPVVVQFWHDGQPPEDLAAVMASWPARNPGWRYRCFDLAGARAFLAATYGADVQRAFRRAREPAMQADLFRLAVLYAEGGVYADADDRCLHPIATLLPGGVGFVGFHEEHGTLGNNVMAAAKLHPVIGCALGLAVAAVLRGDDDMIWLTTGPGLLTRAFARTLAESPLAPAALLARVRILDRHELERVVATHCAVQYKQSRRHWLRASFGEMDGAGAAGNAGAADPRPSG